MSLQELMGKKAIAVELERGEKNQQTYHKQSKIPPPPIHTPNLSFLRIPLNVNNCSFNIELVIKKPIFHSQNIDALSFTPLPL